MEKRTRALMEVDDMPFGFMLGKRTTGALFIVRRMQEEYGENHKNCTCVLWIQQRLLIEFQVYAMSTEKERTTRDLDKSGDEFV